MCVYIYTLQARGPFLAFELVLWLLTPKASGEINISEIEAAVEVREGAKSGIAGV